MYTTKTTVYQALSSGPKGNFALLVLGAWGSCFIKDVQYAHKSTDKGWPKLPETMWEQVFIYIW